MTFSELRQALAVFQLNERASLKEIKARHRELVKTFHPDRGKPQEPGKIQQINEAHAILMAYCQSYRFCFSEQEFLEQCPEEHLRRQFSQDPVWWGGDESSEG